MTEADDFQRSALALLANRVSYPRLTEPAPVGAELESILLTALRAPDHMMLRPARYLLIEGDARARLGEVFVEAAKARGEESEAKLEKCLKMPMRAPLVLVAISKNVSHSKVPVFEQEQSVASGLTHILLALQVSGYGGIWRTGDMAVSRIVKERLEIAQHESLIGFLYIGTPVGEAKPLPPFSFSDYFSYWS